MQTDKRTMMHADMECPYQSEQPISNEDKISLVGVLISENSVHPTYLKI